MEKETQYDEYDPQDCTDNPFASYQILNGCHRHLLISPHILAPNV
jgi:hypothetical protein